jgi:hypothetical protein
MKQTKLRDQIKVKLKLKDQMYNLVFIYLFIYSSTTNIVRSNRKNNKI